MLSKFSSLIYIIKIAIHDIKYVVKMIKLKREGEEVYFAYLRKTCHVLDKGLHTVPFEKGHGDRAYKEAKLLNSRISDSIIKNDPSYLWCSTVIENYEKAQKEGACAPNNPYLKFTNQQKNDFYNLMKWRVSTRHFNHEIVPDSIWNDVIEMASQAPNSCCKQTTRYYLISDPRILTSVVKYVAGATGFNNYIPYLVCVTSDLRPYAVIDRFLHLIDSALSVENFVLAARVNNVFTTILNWQHASDRDNEEVKHILNIPSYEQINLFIAAGYSDNVPVKPARLSNCFIRKM